MRKVLLVAASLAMAMCSQACIDLGASDLLVSGTPFVVQGTMTVADNDGACLVWWGENGASYYLYQDPLLDSDIFDQVTTPGAISRLVVFTRSDLPTPCTVDEVVQVQEVLEIAQ